MNEQPRIIHWITHDRFHTTFAVLSLLAIVAVVAIFYTFRPYDGMYLHLYGGELWVSQVDAGGPAERAGIKVDDRILTVDGYSPKSWGRPLYPAGLGPGDVVNYELLRDEQAQTVSVTMGSYFDTPTKIVMTLGQHLLALFFWLVGVAMCRFALPEDVRAQLFGLFWLAAAVAIASTSPNGWVCLFTMTLMGVSINVGGALFAIAHIHFPVPIPITYRKPIIYTVIGVALLLSLLITLEDWVLVPQGLHLPGLMGVQVFALRGIFEVSAVLIGVTMLIYHRFKPKNLEVRRQVNIALWGAAFTTFPYTVLTILDYIGSDVYTLYSYVALFSVFFPLAHLYVVYQWRLIRVDFIINRIIVSMVMWMLVATLSVPAFGAAALLFDLPFKSILIGALLAAFLALLSPTLYQIVQRRVDQVLYGHHYDFFSVTSGFAERLAGTLDRDSFVQLLGQDLTQQMGVQRAALYLVEQDRLEAQAGDGALEAIPLDDELCQALLNAQRPMHKLYLWKALSPAAQGRWQDLAWAQLFVPVIFKGQLVGLLLLGERSPGDIYTHQDVAILATIARQSALAHENVGLVETLRGLHHQMIRAGEAQRKQIARDLHDTVLQQLFFVKQGLFRAKDHSSLVDLLDETIQTLRQTIRSQRPAFLNHGLDLALKALVEQMQAHAGPQVSVSYHGNVSERLPLSDEQNTALYRILQEGLTNAIKHAKAENIQVGLEQSAENVIKLWVEDDGVGVVDIERHARLADGHYGLRDMQERAFMIGAELRLDSIPGQGTSVMVQMRV